MEPMLQLVGISHHTAPLALRESLAIPPRDLPDALASLRASSGADEALILSTCNRVELYTILRQPASTDGAIDLLCHRSRLAPERLAPSLYQRADAEAARHLIRVTAGLDSMVLGESEITAQVKQAYELARIAGATGPRLNRLVQKALQSAKLIRSRTRIAEGQASIGSVVVALANQRFEERLPDAEVLLWGAGKAAETTARHLLKRGIRRLRIVSRRDTTAQQLATLCRAGWLSWEQARAHLAHVDLAIICTQAPHYVIDGSDVETLMPQRAGRPLCLIDLAVPRNVDPGLKGQPGITLYDLEDVQALAQAGRSQREQQRVQCEALIEQRLSRLWPQPSPTRHKEAHPCRSTEVGSLV